MNSITATFLVLGSIALLLSACQVEEEPAEDAIVVADVVDTTPDSVPNDVITSDAVDTSPDTSMMDMGPPDNMIGVDIPPWDAMPTDITPTDVGPGECTIGVSPGACTNPSDCSLLASMDQNGYLEGHLSMAVLGCDRMSAALCLNESLDANGGMLLSLPCAECWVELGFTQITTCEAPCSSATRRAECVDCVNSNGGPALEACAGVDLQGGYYWYPQ